MSKFYIKGDNFYVVERSVKELCLVKKFIPADSNEFESFVHIKNPHFDYMTARQVVDLGRDEGTLKLTIGFN